MKQQPASLSFSFSLFLSLSLSLCQSILAEISLILSFRMGSAAGEPGRHSPVIPFPPAFEFTWVRQSTFPFFPLFAIRHQPHSILSFSFSFSLFLSLFLSLALSLLPSPYFLVKGLYYTTKAESSARAATNGHGARLSQSPKAREKCLHCTL